MGHFHVGTVDCWLAAVKKDEKYRRFLKMTLKCNHMKYVANMKYGDIQVSNDLITIIHHIILLDIAQ
jgi:hypothetical protein